MVAKGFDGMYKEIGEIKNDIDKRFEGVEESIQAVRGDILSLGDRSVQRYEFEDLRTRFNRLEQKVKAK